jgi:hypothetical protein
VGAIHRSAVPLRHPAELASARCRLEIGGDRLLCTGDTTQTRARQRAGVLELSAIASVLRKLRRLIRPERAAKAKFLANAPQELKALSC